MSEFFAMGGYGFYIWGSYGIAAAVIVLEILSLRGRRRRALEEAHAGTPETLAAVPATEPAR